MLAFINQIPAIVLLGIFVIMLGLDAYSTRIGLASGKASEANPLMAALMSVFGNVDVALAVKSIVSLGIALALLFYIPYGNVVLLVVCIVYAVFLISNFSIISG